MITVDFSFGQKTTVIFRRDMLYKRGRPSEIGNCESFLGISKVPHEIIYLGFSGEGDQLPLPPPPPPPSLAFPLFGVGRKGLAQSHRAFCSWIHPEVRENHAMNFIKKHVSSNYYFCQLLFNRPYKQLDSHKSSCRK